MFCIVVGEEKKQTKDVTIALFYEFFRLIHKFHTFMEPRMHLPIFHQ
jgi:hypothetical protein